MKNTAGEQAPSHWTGTPCQYAGSDQVRSIFQQDPMDCTEASETLL